MVFSTTPLKPIQSLSKPALSQKAFALTLIQSISFIQLYLTFIALRELSNAHYNLEFHLKIHPCLILFSNLVSKTPLPHYNLRFPSFGNRGTPLSQFILKYPSVDSKNTPLSHYSLKFPNFNDKNTPLPYFIFKFGIKNTTASL